GRFFSSGADFKGIAKAQGDDTNKYPSETSKWVSNFVARNVYVTDAFIKHSKVLICCLNGVPPQAVRYNADQEKDKH
ncbi:hypothetical protein, partial [Klebsiella pneumoniae]|uniref:hypothetical protein n=1 Tax=Klebsiella pneumoniae TaxID=573 RepID=UPI002731C4E5